MKHVSEFKCNKPFDDLLRFVDTCRDFNKNPWIRTKLDRNIPSPNEVEYDHPFYEFDNHFQASNITVERVIANKPFQKLAANLGGRNTMSPSPVNNKPNPENAKSNQFGVGRKPMAGNKKSKSPTFTQDSHNSNTCTPTVMQNLSLNQMNQSPIMAQKRSVFSKNVIKPKQNDLNTETEDEFSLNESENQNFLPKKDFLKKSPSFDSNVKTIVYDADPYMPQQLVKSKAFGSVINPSFYSTPEQSHIQNNDINSTNFEAVSRFQHKSIHEGDAAFNDMDVGRKSIPQKSLQFFRNPSKEVNINIKDKYSKSSDGQYENRSFHCTRGSRRAQNDYIQKISNESDDTERYLYKQTSQDVQNCRRSIPPISRDVSINIKNRNSISSDGQIERISHPIVRGETTSTFIPSASKNESRPYSLHSSQRPDNQHGYEKFNTYYSDEGNEDDPSEQRIQHRRSTHDQGRLRISLKNAITDMPSSSNTPNSIYYKKSTIRNTNRSTYHKIVGSVYDPTNKNYENDEIDSEVDDDRSQDEWERPVMRGKSIMYSQSIVDLPNSKNSRMTTVNFEGHRRTTVIPRSLTGVISPSFKLEMLNNTDQDVEVDID